MGKERPRLLASHENLFSVAVAVSAAAIVVDAIAVAVAEEILVADLLQQLGPLQVSLWRWPLKVLLPLILLLQVNANLQAAKGSNQSDFGCMQQGR